MRKRIHALDHFIGGKIVEARRLRGLTVSQLARRLGITSKRLLDYERGRTITRLRLIVVLSAQLDIPPAWFFQGYNGGGAS